MAYAWFQSTLRIGRESDPRSAFKTTPLPGFVATRTIDRGWSQCIGMGRRRADGHRRDNERTTRSVRAANAEDAGIGRRREHAGIRSMSWRAGSRGAESAMRARPAPAASGARRWAGHSRAGSDGPHGMERLTGRIGRRNDRNDSGPEIRRTRIAVTAFSQARWCPDTPAAARLVRGPGRPTARRCRRTVRAALVDGDLRRSADAPARPLGAVVFDRFAVPSVQRRFSRPPRSGTLPAAAAQAPVRSSWRVALRQLS